MKIKGLSLQTVNSIKRYCSQFKSDSDLKGQINKLLREKDINAIKLLDSKDKDFIPLESFERLIDTYFSYYDFSSIRCGYFKTIEQDLRNFFGSLESIDLDETYRRRIAYSFFDKLKDLSMKKDGRNFYELLVSSEFINSNVIRDYLDIYNHDELYSNEITVFMSEIYKFLDDKSQSSFDKINYVIANSETCLLELLNEPSRIRIVFSDKIVQNFDKESLLLMYRDDTTYDYEKFNELSEEALKVLGMMNRFVMREFGHNHEFLASVFDYIGFEGALEDFYDKYGITNIDYKNNDDFFRLMNVFLNYSYGDVLSDIVKDGNCRSLVDLKNRFSDYRVNKNFELFNLEINSEDDLDKLKDLYFRLVFNISTKNAIDLREKYYTFLSECESDISPEFDKELSILKSINDILSLSLEDKSKILLTLGAVRYFVTSGEYKKNENLLSHIILISMFNKMYMSSLKKDLFDVKEKAYVLERGVRVVDAGTKFNMVVSTINATNEFFLKKDSVYDKFNSNLRSNNQGNCCSFINNENLGVINLNSPLFGYNSMDVNSLSMMGVGDVYSITDGMDLRRKNNGIHQGCYFMSGKCLSNNSRFGYNEVVFDRYLMRDSDNTVKLQPDYIVVYKIDENYKSTKMYKQGLKIAKEFGIPLVLVDVPKVKRSEAEEISNMICKLIEKRDVDSKLVEDIVTRLMNNYTGSLAIRHGEGRRGNKYVYGEDFSIKMIDRFLSRIERKFRVLSDSQKLEWDDALRRAYLKEERKNFIASTINGYSCSIKSGEFVLRDRIKFLDRLDTMCDIPKETYFSPDNDRVEVDVLVDLCNELAGCPVYKYEKNEKGARIVPTDYLKGLSDEEKDAYGVVISHLLGDYKDNYFSNLVNCKKDRIKLNSSSTSLEVSISQSSYYSSRELSRECIIKACDAVSNMCDERFCGIIKPLLEKQGELERLPFNNIKNTLMVRKQRLSGEFDKYDKKINISKLRK